MITCQYCTKDCKNHGGLGAHQPYCKFNPNRTTRPKSPNAHARKGRIPWNKGKTGCHAAWNKGMTGLKGHSHTEVTKHILSDAAKKRKLGGYVHGSGRGKSGWYKGIYCDSSWELAYVVYCLDHNIPIQRNTERRPYIWNGSERNYIPDFIVQGVLTEIKGYKTEQWMAKIASNPDVKVLYEEDLLDVFCYVKNKYGNTFIDLYEKK